MEPGECSRASAVWRRLADAAKAELSLGLCVKHEQQQVEKPAPLGDRSGAAAGKCLGDHEVPW